ncbi:hypothetical protein ELQ92_14740 [Labedella populi]|uniref:TetR family transcriptional regulator n=1 Tax=Labedella populi TaxID=2498850 RepID=A0A3S4AF02_9MICO|nr:hypothetical protein [Labedella populi]RWZ58278.1 hypothetical protein ELQ92_14740 [Labedella populi]
MLERAAEQMGARWTAPLEKLAHHLVAILDGITTTWLADGASEAARATARFAAGAFAAHAVEADDASDATDATDVVRLAARSRQGTTTSAVVSP